MQADVASYIEAVRAHVAGTPGISEAIAYVDVPDGIRDVKAFVDLESVEQREPTVIDYWDTIVRLRIVVVVPRALDSKITAWDLAMALALRTRQVEFGSSAPAEVVSVARESTRLDHDIDACELVIAQRVCWQSPTTQSDGDWQVSPSSAYAGRVPDVGPDHIDDYEEISTAP